TVGPPRKEVAMGADDKVRNMAEDVGGKAKEAAGKVTDNERLEAEGKADQVSADVKQTGEKIKDVFDN
ncbi:MAG TPA: CsbD family protein, partial [Jiangellaceae bacterium]|nr:CsbD family protein [Jiangellaceae bacterium]